MRSILEYSSNYFEIAGGYKYAALRVGVVLMAPDGAEVYFQPGDDTASFYETLESLDDRRGIIADIAFSEYFA